MSIFRHREQSRPKLVNQLRRDEGEKLYAYEDSRGYLTIGVGRLIDKRRGGGISPEESDMLLANDIKSTERGVRKAIDWFSQLDAARQGVLLNMAFQLGVGGLLEFKHTLAAVYSGNYLRASDEMLHSKWARQTPNRAHRLADQMRTGEWQ